MTEQAKPGGAGDTVTPEAAAAATAAPDAAKVAADAAAKAASDAAAAAAASIGAATSEAEKAAAAKAAEDLAKGDAAKEKVKPAEEVKAAPKAPSKYELKIPDTASAMLGTADVKLLEDIARGADWTNEEAQAALEEQIAIATAQSERFTAETLADPEYGGDHFEETKRLARAVIDRVRPDGHGRRENFLRFMGRGGAGNHVEVLSFLADLGKMMGEDSPIHARGASGKSTESAASKLYDHPDSKKLDAGA